MEQKCQKICSKIRTTKNCQKLAPIVDYVIEIFVHLTGILLGRDAILLYSCSISFPHLFFHPNAHTLQCWKLKPYPLHSPSRLPLNPPYSCLHRSHPCLRLVRRRSSNVVLNNEHLSMYKYFCWLMVILSFSWQLLFQVLFSQFNMLSENWDFTIL